MSQDVIPQIPADLFPVVTPPATKPEPAAEPVVVDAGPAPVPLEALIRSATPLFRLWADTQREGEERRLALEDRRLEADSRRQRLILGGIFALAISVLALAGALVATGRDASAVELIRLLITLGGAVAGGYGLASAGRRAQSEDR